MTAGRPDKLTSNMHENVIAAVNSSASDSMVADLVGVDNKTIYRWSVRGMNDLLDGIDSKYATFCRDYKRAKAERDVRLVQFVEAEAATNWQAAMRLLEARRAHEFGRGSAYREPVDLKVDNRDTFIDQLLQMVVDNHISADEALKLAKIRLDTDNTEHKTTLTDRLKRLEME